MDSPLLVTAAEQDSWKLLQRLDTAGVPIVAAYRYWDVESGTDRLILASPSIEKDGPRELYRVIQKELRAAPPLTLKLSEISVLPPEDDLVQSLGHAIGGPPIARGHAVGSGPNGAFADLLMLRSLPRHAVSER